MTVPPEAITAGAEAIHQMQCCNAPCESADEHEYAVDECRGLANLALVAAVPLIAAPYIAALARHQHRITDKQGTLCAGCLRDWPCPDLPDGAP